MRSLKLRVHHVRAKMNIGTAISTKLPKRLFRSARREPHVLSGRAR